MRTEDVSTRYAELDLWPANDVALALAEAQLAATAVVRSQAPQIAAAAEAAAARLAGKSGRLVYAGAGASGRLAVQDGTELWPTYGWPAARLVYLMAGGDTALVKSVEGAEDGAAEAAAEVARLALDGHDVMIAIAASGRTPYTVAAAEAARAAGALVIGISNNAGTPLLAAADHPIALETGAEVVAGSTRMAAGTAQKATLGILSTTTMVRLKRVYSNLMVDLSSSNLKLDHRRDRHRRPDRRSRP